MIVNLKYFGIEMIDNCYELKDNSLKQLITLQFCNHLKMSTLFYHHKKLQKFTSLSSKYMREVKFRFIFTIFNFNIKFSLIKIFIFLSIAQFSVSSYSIFKYSMTYRQCRNFTQMLRALNYPRLVSLENFKKPNFQLVADILYWLAQRYDPNTQISDNINQEHNRVEFIKSITTLFTIKARLKINPKKLYQADTSAVQEMLKITTVLYKAYNSPGTEQQQSSTFSLPTKISNLKAHKILANQICDLGAKLYDSLSRQPDLKKNRSEALTFLDSMGQSSDGTSDQAYIQKSIKQIIGQQDDNMSRLSKHVKDMERQQKKLEQNIKKKSGELQRAEKRYKTLVNVKPAFMDEYQRLEAQLERLYQIYVQKYRNLDYLDSIMDVYNKKQEQKMRKNQKIIKKRQQSIVASDQRLLRGEQQITEAMIQNEMINSENRGVSRGNERSRKDQLDRKIDPRGDLQVPEDEGEDDQDDDDQDDDEDGEGDEEDEDEEDGDDSDDQF